MTHDYCLEDSYLKNRYHKRQKVREQQPCVKQASKHHKQEQMSLVDTEAIVEFFVKGQADDAPRIIVNAGVLVVRQSSQPC